jgi:molybdate transport repressor ModE-like protein
MQQHINTLEEINLIYRAQRITLDGLRLLDSIERNGSFSKAARELCVVTSTVTHAVRTMEENLGLQIFDRSGHQARFTTKGLALFKRGQNLLALADTFDVEAQQIATGWEPQLNITVDEVVPLNPIIALLRDFVTVAPNTSLNIGREAANGSWDALLEGRSDLIVGAPSQYIPPGRSIEFCPFVDWNFVFVVSTQHPLAKQRGVVKNVDLLPFRAVVLRDTARSLVRLGYGLSDNDSHLALPDENSKLTAILLGLGVGFLPKPMALPFLKRGELKVLRVDMEQPPGSGVIAWRSGETGQAIQWWVKKMTEDNFRRRLFTSIER